MEYTGCMRMTWDGKITRSRLHDSRSFLQVSALLGGYAAENLATTGNGVPRLKCFHLSRKSQDADGLLPSFGFQSSDLERILLAISFVRGSWYRGWKGFYLDSITLLMYWYIYIYIVRTLLEVMHILFASSYVFAFEGCMVGSLWACKCAPTSKQLP